MKCFTNVLTKKLEADAVSNYLIRVVVKVIQWMAVFFNSICVSVAFTYFKTPIQILVFFFLVTHRASHTRKLNV